jgi:hypothetical protein
MLVRVPAFRVSDQLVEEAGGVEMAVEGYSLVSMSVIQTATGTSSVDERPDG